MHLKLIFLVSLLTTTGMSQAQHPDILEPIHNLFNGMRAGDGELIASAFAPEATMETYLTKDGVTSIASSSAADFIRAAGQPHDDVWNEVIWSYDVRKDGPLATVWTEYTFYMGNRRLHCGVNAFQLMHDGEEWKITRVTDTRRQENCKELPDENSPEMAMQKEIDEQVWEPFKKAYKNFDAILMNDLHTDDFIRANSWRITVGDEYKKQNSKRYQEGRERGDQRSIDFVFDSRKATDTHAVETGFYIVTSVRGGVSRDYYGYFNVILRKEDGAWKIAYDWDTDSIKGEKITRDWINKE